MLYFTDECVLFRAKTGKDEKLSYVVVCFEVGRFINERV